MLSYIRTQDGFLTAMHDTVPVEDGTREVAIFNPGSNANQESLLRLVNMGDAQAVVTISGIDDSGASPGDGATVSIPPGESRTYTAAELESGNAAGLNGSLGDGAGKWRLAVESEQEIVAMSLLSSPTGHLTNLSTAPDNGTDGVHSVPLFPSASDANARQGFLRVVNRSDEAGDVTVRAFDDTDVEYDTLTLSMGVNETRHFNSDDLELGNADKGLSGSTGAGEGDWRLELGSDLDIEVLSYIRTDDGFLTAMHDLVPRSAKRHRVAVFNPGSNANQVSVLRLVNAGEEAAEVTVPAGGSVSYTAAELESGGADGLQGVLGDGAGKWSLTINADRPVEAMSLLSSPTGHLTNLSTAPERGAGPEETVAEAFEALISPIVQSKCVNCHVEGGSSGHTPLVFVRDPDVDHLAKNLKVFEDYLADVEDGADRILNKIQGALAHGGGAQVAAGTEEYAGFGRFMELLGAEVERPDVSIDNLFEVVTFESPRRTLWRSAIMFAGRIPTEVEYASIDGGTDDDLKRAIRRLMEGPAFHEFLIRGANDRLLTDRDNYPIDATTSYFVAFHNLYYAKLAESGERFADPLDDPAFWRWEDEAGYGIGRAALELIAHVAENDLSYTEILTADYIMANPLAAEAYGAETDAFANARDPQEFNPSEIVSYYRDCGDHVTDEDTGQIVDPGSCETDYPHAGILNTTVFLKRYPTTATNRNRARSRWTYYHFLGFDVESSRARTMDPTVLRDTKNPTLNNPACTACHIRLDPLAGAFQNYGDVGYYRDQPGGHHSLDLDYRIHPSGGEDVTVKELSWDSRETVTVEGILAAGANEIGLQVILPPDHDFSGWTPHLSIDHVSVWDTDGDLVERYDLEELFAERDHWPESGEYCGQTISSASNGSRDAYQLWECTLAVPIETTRMGTYSVGVSTWILDGEEQEEDPDPTATLRIWAPAYFYQEGDTWYRDMRDPGFVREPGSVHELVPGEHNHNSLQWLARRIVDDERFAEAAVKFWWPAIMGDEVAAHPENEEDADFEARKLRASHQANEVRRLAIGFRRGFAWSGKGPHNLKDLLAELAMSEWFRADSATIDDAFMRTALRGAGAKRLLTPTELVRKTGSITGVRWGRNRPLDPSPYRWGLSKLNDTWLGYGLLYGGIDSDGVTDRARDMSSVMAGVAQSHAVEMSCPIVLREFYLLSEEDRRLFGGLDETVTPVLEFRDSFGLSGESESEAETVSVEGHVDAGGATVVLAFVNDFIDEDLGDRNLVLDRLTVWRGEEEVGEWEIEDLEVPDECHHSIGDDALTIYHDDNPCTLAVPFDISTAGVHRFDVRGWGDQAGDELPMLEVTVETDSERSRGAARIRSKLAELFGRLMGIEVSDDAPEVDAAYSLFVDVWDVKRTAQSPHFLWSGSEDWLQCDWHTDHYYFGGIADHFWSDEPNEHGDATGWDWAAINDYLDSSDSDRRGAARTWVVVLAYLLMDYRYLYL